MHTFAKSWPLFAMVALWDAITTVIGTIAALGGAAVITAVFGFLTGLAVLAILFFTFDIWSKQHPVLRDFPIIEYVLKGLWSLAIVYNASTAFYGNAVALGVPLNSPGQWFVLAGSTIIVSGSTLVASFLFYWDRRYVEENE